MTDLVTVTGVVGSDPRHTVTATGLPITNFRLASTRRFFDRATGAWTDGETNWYTVSSFRQLALNSARSIRRGERVVVHGRLRVRAWETGERSGTAIEIDADAIGHDLSWGVAVYSKTSASKLVEPVVEDESDPTTDDSGAGGDLAEESRAATDGTVPGDWPIEHGWTTGSPDATGGDAEAAAEAELEEDADLDAVRA